MKDDFITFDYISINVKSDLEQMYIDCYKNFGWVPITNAKRDYYINSNTYQDIVSIKFKRNRSIKDKDELKKLQEKCEKAILTINKLEKIPHSLATMYALIAAFVGVIFMVMFAFAVTGDEIMWLMAIFCGAIGIIGIILPYFIYKNVINKKEAENKGKIEEEKDIIYDACEKARKILQEE